MWCDIFVIVSELQRRTGLFKSMVWKPETWHVPLFKTIVSKFKTFIWGRYVDHYNHFITLHSKRFVAYRYNGVTCRQWPICMSCCSNCLYMQLISKGTCYEFCPIQRVLWLFPLPPKRLTFICREKLKWLLTCIAELTCRWNCQGWYTWMSACIPTWCELFNWAPKNLLSKPVLKLQSHRKNR